MTMAGRLVALVLLAALVCGPLCVLGDEFGTTSHVTVLTTENFDRLVGDNLWLIKFYAVQYKCNREAGWWMEGCQVLTGLWCGWRRGNV